MVIGMTRRKFLLSATLMGTLFGLVSCSSLLASLGFSREHGTTVPEIRPWLFGLFGDLDSAQSLGKRYLDLYPQEAQRALLLAAHIQSAQPRTSSELKKMLARERELDFRTSRTVIIDGWLLARTEVEACALTILL